MNSFTTHPFCFLLSISLIINKKSLIFYFRVSFTQSPKHHDDAIRDYELVTSVAAAAFAIHSLEETEVCNLQKMRQGPKSSSTQSMRRKEDNISRRPSYGN